MDFSFYICRAIYKCFKREPTGDNKMPGILFDSTNTLLLIIKHRIMKRFIFIMMVMFAATTSFAQCQKTTACKADAQTTCAKNKANCKKDAKACQMNCKKDAKAAKCGTACKAECKNGAKACTCGTACKKECKNGAKACQGNCKKDAKACKKECKNGKKSCSAKAAKCTKATKAEAKK
jgi:hypothetical protein